MTDIQTRDRSLRPGDLVVVKSAEEIIATLDEDGRLDGLPFMPEMLRFCGRTMIVHKTAKVTCGGRADLREMDNAVFLTGVRCDGAAHDGCQARCLIHWKEAWLERVDGDSVRALPGPGGDLHPGQPDRSLLPLIAPTTKDTPDAAPRYLCQATEILDATSPLPFTRLSQYPHHVRNWGLWRLVKVMLVALVNKYQLTSRRLPRMLRIKDGRTFPMLAGTLQSTPSAADELQPGDRVRIKSRAEIEATLDTNNANRGLIFDVEELRFCGQTATVLQRVERIIDERSGEMITIGSDAYMLDGVVCPGDYHRLCARGIYSYWRSVWLEKLDPSDAPTDR
ncbi:hypothetical protein [Euzebya pacifica]|uniref:hypothetical protein n=1 Tax=Euzebya pacifica TaxID=1608957 RepID=UPI0030F9C987